MLIFNIEGDASSPDVSEVQNKFEYSMRGGIFGILMELTIVSIIAIAGNNNLYCVLDILATVVVG